MDSFYDRMPSGNELHAWSSSAAYVDPAVESGPSNATLREFAEIYSQNVTFVWSVLRRLGIPMAQLDDSVQDVFIAAFRNFGRYEARSSHRAWLYGIARKIAWRYRRGAQRQRRKREALAWAIDRAQTASQGSYSVDVLRLLDEALSILDEERRAVFLLSELHGLTAREIAEATELKITTVESRLKSARRKLRHFVEFELAEHAPEGADWSWSLQELVERSRRDDRPSSTWVARAWLLLLPKLGVAGAVAATSGTATPAALWAGKWGARSLTSAGGAALVWVALALPDASSSGSALHLNPEPRPAASRVDDGTFEPRTLGTSPFNENEAPTQRPSAWTGAGEQSKPEAKRSTDRQSSVSTAARSTDEGRSHRLPARQSDRPGHGGVSGDPEVGVAEAIEGSELPNQGGGSHDASSFALGNFQHLGNALSPGTGFASSRTPSAGNAAHDGSGSPLTEESHFDRDPALSGRPGQVGGDFSVEPSVKNPSKVGTGQVKPGEKEEESTIFDPGDAYCAALPDARELLAVAGSETLKIVSADGRTRRFVERRDTPNPEASGIELLELNSVGGYLLLGHREDDVEGSQWRSYNHLGERVWSTTLAFDGVQSAWQSPDGSAALVEDTENGWRTHYFTAEGEWVEIEDFRALRAPQSESYVIGEHFSASGRTPGWYDHATGEIAELLFDRASWTTPSGLGDAWWSGRWGDMAWIEAQSPQGELRRTFASSDVDAVGEDAKWEVLGAVGPIVVIRSGHGEKAKLYRIRWGEDAAPSVQALHLPRGLTHAKVDPCFVWRIDPSGEVLGFARSMSNDALYPIGFDAEATLGKTIATDDSGTSPWSSELGRFSSGIWIRRNAEIPGCARPNGSEEEIGSSSIEFFDERGARIYTAFKDARRVLASPVAPCVILQPQGVGDRAAEVLDLERSIRTEIPGAVRAVWTTQPIRSTHLEVTSQLTEDASFGRALGSI